MRRLRRLADSSSLRGSDNLRASRRESAALLSLRAGGHPSVGLMAARRIAAGESVTLDYGSRWMRK